MRNSTRVIINTGSQYVRSILQVVITLYTSRIILENLGVDDYGIYSLIAGVVAMLSFIQTNLAKTNQRFLSYYQGKEDFDMLRSVFNNSIITQIVISVILCGTLWALTDPVINHLLNIAPERLHDAKMVYWIMLISLFFNLLSTPFYAVLIAHENILYSSIVQMVGSILKLPIAISLFYIANQKLVAYSWMMCGLMFMDLCCYAYYAVHRYPECKKFNLSNFHYKLWKEMFGFMIWGIYGTFCVVGRSQGFAILINRTFTTAINAAYGIGTQMVGQLSFLSVAITTAMNPQIIKAEGAGNRRRVFRLSEISTKYSFLLISIILVPICIYIEPLLDLWLKTVPSHTAMFCRWVIIAALFDWITQGLVTVNTAVGNVRAFSIYVNTVQILSVPVAWFVISKTKNPQAAMMIFALFSLITSLVRLIYLKFNIGLSIRSYCRNVIFCSVPILIANSVICMQLYFILPQWWGLLVAGIVSFGITCVGTMTINLNPDEKEILKRLISRFRKK